MMRAAARIWQRSAAKRRINDIILHVCAAHVQDELLTRRCARSAFCMQAPVGMRAVQVAVRRDHFRLKPQTEHHPKVIHVLYKLLQPVRQLAPVNHPVSQRAVVQIAMPEPAVVQYKELNAGFCCSAGDVHDLFMVEIEIRGLPVVDQDGTLPVAPGSAAKALAIQGMICLTHAVEAGITPHADGLRRLQRFTGRQMPLQRARIQSCHHTCRVIGVFIDCNLEITAINEVNTQAFPRKLGCIRHSQCGKGVMLVAGRAARRGDRSRQSGRCNAFRLSFLCPRPFQVQHVPPSVQRQANASGAKHRQRRHSFINIADGRRQYRTTRIQREAQVRRQPGTRILQRNAQRLRLFRLLRIRSGQPRQRRLSGTDAVIGIIEYGAPLSGLFPRRNHCRAEIAPAFCRRCIRQNLPQRVKRRAFRFLPADTPGGILQRRANVSMQQLFRAGFIGLQREHP